MSSGAAPQIKQYRQKKKNLLKKGRGKGRRKENRGRKEERRRESDRSPGYGRSEEAAVGSIGSLSWKERCFPGRTVTTGAIR